MYLFLNPKDATRPQSKAATLSAFNPRAQFVHKALDANILRNIGIRGLRGSDLNTITAYNTGASGMLAPNLPPYQHIEGYGGRPYLTARPLRGLGAYNTRQKRIMASLKRNLARTGRGLRRLSGLNLGQDDDSDVLTPIAGTVYAQDPYTADVYDTTNGNLIASGSTPAYALPPGAVGPVPSQAQALVSSAQAQQEAATGAPAAAISPTTAQINAAEYFQTGTPGVTPASVIAAAAGGASQIVAAQRPTAAVPAPSVLGISSNTLLLLAGGVLLVALVAGKR